MKQVAVIFGGRSVEHEISIISGIQAISTMDTTRYHIHPVYIAHSGRWYTGPQLVDKAFYRKLPDALETLTEVTILPKPRVGGLTVLSKKQGLLGKLLDKESIIPIDVVFPAFHGQYGEDGCIQGLLEMADIPYVGCDVAGSAVAMNKYFCKVLAQALDIPVLPCALIDKADATKNLAAARAKILSTPGLSLPLFIKPCHLGSSIGVSRVFQEADIDAALVKVFRYDNQALIEPCVTDLMEINVSVTGGDSPRASVVEIPVASDGVLSYEDKYLRGGKGSKGKASGSSSEGMASLTRVIDPKDLDPKIKESVQNSAVTLYKTLAAGGSGRFDFIVDTKKDQLYFNEYNPIPGSFAFYLWEKSTPPLLFTPLLSEIIDAALVRHESKQALEHDTGFKALK